MASLLQSMPVFKASGRESERSVSISALKKAGSTGYIPLTPEVFWAVSAEGTEYPCRPKLLNTRRSACSPAPPPGSEPAMVSAVFINSNYKS
jgi:hypothetical protein